MINWRGSRKARDTTGLTLCEFAVGRLRLPWARRDMLEIRGRAWVAVLPRGNERQAPGIALPPTTPLGIATLGYVLWYPKDEKS